MNAEEVSPDEERMLTAYRRFVRRSPPGSVFSWQSPMEVPGIDVPRIVTDDFQFVVRDPRDVSSISKCETISTDDSE